MKYYNATIIKLYTRVARRIMWLKPCLVVRILYFEYECVVNTVVATAAVDPDSCKTQVKLIPSIYCIVRNKLNVLHVLLCS